MNETCISASGLPCLDGTRSNLTEDMFQNNGQPIVRTRRSFLLNGSSIPDSQIKTVYLPYDAIIPARERPHTYEDYGLDNLAYNPRKFWLIPTDADIREGDEVDDGSWVFRCTAREADVFGYGAQQIVVERDRRSEGYTP